MPINGIYTCNFVAIFTLLKSSDKMILMLYHIYQKYKNDYTRIISNEVNAKKKKKECQLFANTTKKDKKKHWDVNKLYKNG